MLRVIYDKKAYLIPAKDKKAKKNKAPKKNIIKFVPIKSKVTR